MFRSNVLSLSYFCIMEKIILIVILVSSFCLNAQTDILIEGFESGIPSSWIIIDNDHNTLNATVASEFTSAWITVENPDYDTDHVAACASYFDPEGTASRWLITPQINLGTFGNYLHLDARSQDPSYPDSYMVLISISGNAISNFSDTLFISDQTSPTWNNHSIGISDSGYNNVPVYLAFVDNSYYGYKLYLDNIRVEKESIAGLTVNKTIDFKIYPNPVENVLNIETNEKIIQLAIYDLNGKVVLQSNQNNVDVSFLQAGFYTIKISTEKGTGFQKLIKR